MVDLRDSRFSSQQPSRAVLGPVVGWHVRVLAGMVLCIAAGDAAWGQCGPVWTQQMDVPAARVTPAMAYDQARGVVVLFGADNRHVQGHDVQFRLRQHTSLPHRQRFGRDRPR